MLKIDTALTPFSRHGSYLALSQDLYDNPIGKALYLRTCHGKPGVGPNELFRLDALEGGRKRRSRVRAEPAVLRMRAESGRLVELCLGDAETVLIRGREAGLRMEVPPASGRMLYPTEDGRWVLVPSTAVHDAGG